MLEQRLLLFEQRFNSSYSVFVSFRAKSAMSRGNSHYFSKKKTKQILIINICSTSTRVMGQNPAIFNVLNLPVFFFTRRVKNLTRPFSFY